MTLAILCSGQGGQHAGMFALTCACPAPEGLFVRAAAALEGALPRQRCIAGYSVGEMAAWSVGGLFAPRDALELTAARAEAMDAARRGEQGMLFIRGLSRADIESLLAGQDAAVAIVNPGNAFVVAGTQAALQWVAAAAQRPGAARG